MNPTSARPISQDGSHWYTINGEPMYEMMKKDGSGPRATTLADARKLNLLPSVTTILRSLDKPALIAWKIEQAVLAAMTTPKKPDETLDQFVERVLQIEKVQEQEMEAARDLGTRMHEALEFMALAKEVDQDLKPWIFPAWDFIRSLGVCVSAETCVVGQGFAGKVDLMLSPGPDEILLVDYKTTKRLPEKEPWKEHRLQLAAYASTQRAALVRAGNLYVSTAEAGKFVWHEHTDIAHTFVHGFKPLIEHWQWSNGYSPKQ